MKRSQFLGVAGGTLLSLGAGGVALYGAGYRPIRQESQYLASGPEFASLGELARASSLVVRAAVVEAGAPYHVPFDPAVVVAGPAGAVVRGKEGAPPPEPTPDPSTRTPSAAEKGILKTDFTVEVLEVMAGDSVQRGQRLTVAQLGGVDDRGRTVSVEDDPLFKVGEQEVLFLQRDPDSRRFFTVGGGQGRYKITRAESLHPVSAHAPQAKEYSGAPLSALREAIRASK